MPRVYEYLGLAQAIVDFTAPLPSDKCLARVPFTIEKGKRRVISLDERHAILEELEDLGCESQVSCGTSGMRLRWGLGFHWLAVHHAPLATPFLPWTQA